jgi:hypothetical protein
MNCDIGWQQAGLIPVFTCPVMLPEPPGQQCSYR